jgi:uncharacterized SAM-binding protein YcdF (DUF218 family)
VFYLRIVLPVFVLPIGITLLLILAGLASRRRSLVWCGVAVIWLSSTNFVSRMSMRAAEGWAERGSASDAPPADAIVVLSEGRTVAPGKAAVSEWWDADRFFGGVELFRAGKSPLLVFTGGSPPGASTVPEGDILTPFAEEMGVPAAQILKTTRVSSTAEEAHAVADLLHARFSPTGSPARPVRVLLVTSAFHMARARMLFERAGLLVNPFPVDFKVTPYRGVSILDFLPTSASLQQTELAMREGYHRLYYSVVK